MIRRTSIEAFERINEEGLVGPFQRDVYNILYRRGPMTAGEMSIEYERQNPQTHRGRNEVAKRVYELKNFGVVAETGIERECKATGFTCVEWDVTDQLPTKPDKKETKDEKIARLETVIAELKAKIKKLEDQRWESNGQGKLI